MKPDAQVEEYHRLLGGAMVAMRGTNVYQALRCARGALGWVAGKDDAETAEFEEMMAGLKGIRRGSAEQN